MGHKHLEEMTMGTWQTKEDYFRRTVLTLAGGRISQYLWYKHQLWLESIGVVFEKTRPLGIIVEQYKIGQEAKSRYR